jgi:hypothetical protein
VTAEAGNTVGTDGAPPQSQLIKWNIYQGTELFPQPSNFWTIFESLATLFLTFFLAPFVYEPYENRKKVTELKEEQSLFEWFLLLSLISH